MCAQCGEVGAALLTVAVSVGSAVVLAFVGVLVARRACSLKRPVTGVAVRFVLVLVLAPGVLSIGVLLGVR